jgi:excisionase family DNA binding protein
MNHSASGSETLKTKRDAAHFLKIGTRTLDDWMKKRAIPFYKIGKLVRFRQVDLDQALEKFRRI